MSIKTQGTEFWAYNPISQKLLDLGCITSIDGIDSTIEQIETTCLKDAARSYEAGLATPGQASFEVQFDPDNPDHITLQQWKTAGLQLEWFVGFRQEDDDGVLVTPGAAPEVSAGGVIDLPGERAWIIFQGFMSGFPFGFAQNDVVRSGVTIQISGDPEVIPKDPPVTPTGVSVIPSTLAIDVGDTETLAATVTPSGASQSVTWSSSAPSVASVNASTGEVTGVSAGSATITATSTKEPSVSGTCSVTVTEP